jgi:hypothetical protein
MCRRRRTSSAATESLRRRGKGDVRNIGAITVINRLCRPACDDAARESTGHRRRCAIAVHN